MKRTKTALLLAAFCAVAMGADGCGGGNPQESASGVKATHVNVQTDAKGHTTEQNNIGQRLLTDNKSGSVKHLYVISAYSGQTIIYSTVKGKVTSSGKRLTPTTVIENFDPNIGGNSTYGFKVDIGGHKVRTTEVLQDDGTYGSSSEYLYWWDTKDVYHQHYVSGGQIIHISNEPLAVKGIIINMEVTAKKAEEEK